MCLGFPAQIVSITEATAVIDCWGTRKRVGLDTFADAVVPGDFVIAHDGVIVRRIAPDDVADTVSLYETVLGEA